MTADHTISIIGVEDKVDRSIQDRVFRRAEISAEELSQQIGRFLQKMETVVKGVPETLGEFKLDTLTITAELSVKGRVTLLAAGTEIAGKGGLTFILKRSP